MEKNGARSRDNADHWAHPLPVASRRVPPAHGRHRVARARCSHPLKGEGAGGIEIKARPRYLLRLGLLLERLDCCGRWAVRWAAASRWAARRSSSCCWRWAVRSSACRWRSAAWIFACSWRLTIDSTRPELTTYSFGSSITNGVDQVRPLFWLHTSKKYVRKSRAVKLYGYCEVM